MKLKDKIADLERRVKELESRPPIYLPQYVPQPYPVYPQPYNPWPQYVPWQPIQPWITTVGANVADGAASVAYDAANLLAGH